jgi:methionine-rich copper-binding protein CopC
MMLAPHVPAEETSMRKPYLFPAAAALAAALAFAACSNDNNNNPTGPGTDTTPPTVASVASADVRHVNVKFSEAVNRKQAETVTNYTITETSSSTHVTILNASLGSDGRMVMLTTSGDLTTTGYTIQVSGVEDVHGNVIKSATTKEFAGSSIADTTPPQIVHRTPDMDATSVAATDSITVEFSEPLAENNFITAFALTSGAATVPVNITSTDNVHFVVKPQAALDAGKLYTITLTGVADPTGNIMTNTTWSFHTKSGTGGNAAPTLVSSTPANNATNVGINSNIVLTFSEPVDTASFTASFTPVLGTAVTPTWSNGNKTATFTPPGGLTANQQYTMTILPGGVRSTGGAANTDAILVAFTTGTAMELGSISGSITGAEAGPAHNPSGATVLLASADPFGGGDFTVLGATTVKSDGAYVFAHVPAGAYYPFVIMDSNQDKRFDPLTGDAVGLFGANFATGDMNPDSVVVATGMGLSNINFPIYDPTSITGEIHYTGTNSGGSFPVFVGLFSPTNFNRNTSVPIVATTSTWSGTGTYSINSLTVGPIANGSYYVGGFMDVNGNGLYDPGTDPFGLVGSGNVPQPITLNSGKDFPNTTLTLLDPTAVNELPTGVMRLNEPSPRVLRWDTHSILAPARWNVLRSVLNRRHWG